MIYKVSYVIVGGQHRGMVVNQEEAPQVGHRVELDEQV